MKAKDLKPGDVVVSIDGEPTRFEFVADLGSQFEDSLWFAYKDVETTGEGLGHLRKDAEVEIEP